jgi:lysozyme family protein
MISPKDLLGIIGGQEGAFPDKTASVQNNKLTGDSPFEKLLTASFEQIQNEEASFQKNFIGSVLPALNVSRSIEPSADMKFREGLAAVLKHEGSGLVRRDGGRESSKYGILQTTAREFGYKGDIRNITKEEAEGIYRKIWDKSGAESLPYPLSLVHFDTYVNSPAAAKKLLAKSGGNTETYLKMRAQRYHRLAELRPERFGKYLKGWMNRIASLKNITTEYQTLKNIASSGAVPPSKGPIV